MSNEYNEREPVKALYDNLVPYRTDGDTVWVVNGFDGMRYLTVAVADAGGDAGGARMTSSTPHRMFPGINRVPAAYWARVEADAARQRERTGGGILGAMLEKIKSVDLSRTSADKVAGWLATTADLSVIHELRSHPKHQAAAMEAWDAWHSEDCSDQVRTNRHFWAMAEDSRKVA